MPNRLFFPCKLDESICHLRDVWFVFHLVFTEWRPCNVLSGSTLPAMIWASSWEKVGWLCWGLTSQSTIFQSCRDGAIASWVINQYFRGVKCLAQGHNTAEVGLEPRTSRSGVRHSTTEPPRSPWEKVSLGVCDQVRLKPACLATEAI